MIVRNTHYTQRRITEHQTFTQTFKIGLNFETMLNISINNSKMRDVLEMRVTTSKNTFTLIL